MKDKYDPSNLNLKTRIARQYRAEIFNREMELTPEEKEKIELKKRNSELEEKLEMVSKDPRYEKYVVFENNGLKFYHKLSDLKKAHCF